MTKTHNTMAWVVVSAAFVVSCSTREDVETPAPPKISAESWESVGAAPAPDSAPFDKGCTTKSEPWTPERDQETADRAAAADPTFRTSNSQYGPPEDEVPRLAYSLVGHAVSPDDISVAQDRDDVAEQKLAEAVRAFADGDQDTVERLIAEGGSHVAP
jgi:hypothetical protein